MVDKKDKTIITLVSFAVLIILGAVFIASIADQSAVNTQRTKVADEAYNLTGIGCYVGGQVNTSDVDCNITVTYAPTGWKIEDCALTNVVLTNTTGTKTLTLDTDYNLYASTGLIVLKNTTSTAVASMGNNLLIDYSYCADNYVSSSWARDILNVNTGLYAVAILVIGVVAVYLLFGRKEDD